MSLTTERRTEICKKLDGAARFHGAFEYPKECYAFAALAEKRAVEMEPVDGYPYRINIFDAKNREEDCPVHIYIHGGGWVYPHQINDELFCAWLADAIRGIVVDVDYSLSDVAPWPTAFDQCYEVGKYVYARCAQWGGDPVKVSMGGYSAGGALTAGVVLKAARTGEFPLALQVIGYGPLDMKTDPKEKEGRREQTPARLEKERMFTELYLDGDEALAADPYVSPVYASDEALARLPKTLIVTAGECHFRREDEAFGARLAALGVEVTMRRFLGAEHGFVPHFMERWEEGAQLVARCIRSASDGIK